MKKILPFLGVCVMAFTYNVVSPRTATVEGRFVDTRCYGMNEMNAENTHKVVGKDNEVLDMHNCATACANMGIPTGILTETGHVVILVIPTNQLAEHMAKDARVTGRQVFVGGMIPEKVEVRENGEWKEVPIGSMM